MSLLEFAYNHFAREGYTSIASVIDEPPFHLRASATNVMSFGAQTIVDPMTGETEYPWSLTILEDSTKKTLTF